MPLNMCAPGEGSMVKRVGGKPETRQFLENLGFAPGCEVSIVSKIAGNVIVQVKDSRVAINSDMASKIFV